MTVSDRIDHPRHVPPNGPAGHDAALRLVEFVQRLRADHGAKWEPGPADYAAALTLLRQEDWTWGWAWLAAIGFVERTGMDESLARILADGPAFAEVGRNKFGEFVDKLKTSCIVNVNGQFRSTPVWSGDHRINSLVVSRAADVEQHGDRVSGDTRWHVARWFPQEWKSILWLQVRIADHEPNPHALYVGEAQEIAAKSALAGAAPAASMPPQAFVWLKELPPRLVVELKLEKPPSPRTLRDLVRDAGVPTLGDERMGKYFLPENFLLFLKFCREHGRPRPRRGRPANSAPTA
jgi:hypothetical protein